MSKGSMSPPEVIGITLEQIDDEASSLLEGLKRVQAKRGIGKHAKYLVANFMFFTVLVGIEFEMCSLLVGIRTYWNYDQLLLQILLVFFAISFLLPLIIITFFCEGHDDASGHGFTSSAASGSRSTGMAHHLKKLLSVVHPADPHTGKMQIYHWCPCARFWLVVKPSYNLTDVDAIFKVNTLSSFTLGIYQLLAIMTTLWLDMPMNVFVILSIVSQCLNWLITIAYFVSPISQWMGDAANARSVHRHYKGLMTGFAAEQQAVDGSVVDGHRREEAMECIRKMKKHVGDRILSQFFPKEGEGKRAAKDILDNMRDQDVKEYVMLLRNQAMAAIEMPGGV